MGEESVVGCLEHYLLGNGPDHQLRLANALGMVTIGKREHSHGE